ncbi:MAG: ABC transporter ATP-binding protein [Thermoanaerobaculia bacterium]|nr:ABC transporter ATP-binding protein [Thermoanaerobaculia bacterium]
MNQPVIEVRGLVKRFGDFVSVDDVSFDVRPGEVFGLLGSNGAGKTTTIRMLCGLLRPSAGVGHILGIDIAREPERLKRSIGYMTQRFSLYDDLTIGQNLRFFGGVYGLRGAAFDARRSWAIDIAGLRGKEGLMTGSLPGGWKQRLALACALLHEPKVVFLDEPTGGVDPLSRRKFWQLIDSLAASGVALIVTTHYLDEAERCDRIALMHAGRIVAMGSVPELKEVFSGRAMLEVSCPRVLDAQALLERRPGIHEVSAFGTTLHVVVDDADHGRATIASTLAGAGFDPLEIERIVPSLEDVFIHCIEAEDERRDAS